MGREPEINQQMSLPVVDEARLRELCEKIILSGYLGRSPVYKSLLNYLLEKSLLGKSPKEAEIAIDVLGRNAEFDVTKDSVVRVYVHKLRKKIQSYYNGPGMDDPYQLVVAKGQYTITILPKPDVTNEVAKRTTHPLGRSTWLPGLFILLITLVLVDMVYVRTASTDDAAASEINQVRTHPLWASIINNDSPVLIVLGDYFIFGEADTSGAVSRMVREFDINSPRELRISQLDNIERAEKYVNLNLTYLPSSSAIALKDITSVVQSDTRDVTVRMMSELDTDDLKDNHVIYIGYLSAMDKMLELVFASSNIAIGSSYDELINIETGTMYTSSAGLTEDSENFVDYGMISTFPTPAGNQILVIAGTRDAGLEHIAQSLTNPVSLNALSDNVLDAMTDGPIAFEALYEIFGFNRVNFDSMLVYKGMLDYRAIWGGDQIDIGVK